MPKGFPKDKSVKRRILHRLKVAQGHLVKVIFMVEKDDYCIDVIHQSMAVQAALKEADSAVLEDHMKTCVASAIKNGRSKEVIGEVMKVMERKR